MKRTLLLFAALCSLVYGGMIVNSYRFAAAISPPSFVSSVGTSSGSASSTATSPAITPTGPNRFLICTIAEYGQSGNASSVVFNGSENFTLLSGSTGNFYDGGGRTQTWFLINPTSTSATVVVTFPGSTAQHAMTVCAFSGVNQTTPLGTCVTDFSDTARTSMSVSPSTTTADLAYFAGTYVANATLTGDSPMTTRQQNATASAAGVLAGTSTAGASSTTGAFSVVSSLRIYAIGVAIKP